MSSSDEESVTAISYTIEVSSGQQTGSPDPSSSAKSAWLRFWERLSSSAAVESGISTSQQLCKREEIRERVGGDGFRGVDKFNAGVDCCTCM